MFYEKPEVKTVKAECENVMNASGVGNVTEETTGMDDPIELPDIDA